METREKDRKANLATPTQFLKGVGPDRAELLERLGLRTASDLLFYFPRDYEDATEISNVSSFVEDELVSVIGVIDQFDVRSTASGRSIASMVIRDDEGGQFKALWFNQSYMNQKYFCGMRVVLSGCAKKKNLFWEMTHPRIRSLAEDEDFKSGEILPTYGLTDGVKQSHMRRLIGLAVDNFADLVEETFPFDALEKYQLLPIQEALQQIHRPASLELLEAARRRFIFQELFVLQLALAYRRWHLSSRRKAQPIERPGRVHARIVRLFPFELTEAQETVIEEICSDLARDFPMNRLLQGDVGSGKTSVAEYAMLLTVAQGHQAVLMAPTEILAVQHLRTLRRDLSASKVRIGCYTGSMSNKDRRELEKQVATGEVDLVVGTQAIVQSGLRFKNLALVIIDEQHKFGVRQRALLRQSGHDPHYLVMTATPIPRTVSMTLFGDLDTSTIKDKPAGRQAVHTYMGSEMLRDRWWNFVRKKIAEGRQAFVIAPLIESGDDEKTVASVEELYQRLQANELKDKRVAMVHGRMSGDQKNETMRAFADRKYDVLVATSVVEVGIDVPNASIMTIESAERFGLAQLHQLRGRVGRGNHPGFVCVFANEDASERLSAFVESNDGFELAEIDFRLRGPGDLFGTRQHGLPPLRIADLQRDDALLQEARTCAQQLIEQDPEMSDPRYERLRAMVFRRYEAALELGDVG